MKLYDIDLDKLGIKDFKKFISDNPKILNDVKTDLKNSKSKNRQKKNKQINLIIRFFESFQSD